MLSRLIFGARNTIGIAVMTTALSFSIGGLLGLLAAILGGWTDQLLARAVDILMAIPQLIFALMLLSIFGSSITNLILIIAVLDSTRVFRLTRAVAMNVVVLDFVEAARLQGEKLGWIMTREILPNILPPLVAEFGLRFCFVFLTIAALSFLGLGIQPPTADWGSMVRENATLINYGDITPLLPAGAIALLTVAVNFVVDWFLHKTSGLRDEQFAERCATVRPLGRAAGDELCSRSRASASRARARIAGTRSSRASISTLHRGEVLGLIGEFGAGKSTIGLAAMGYAQARLPHLRPARSCSTASTGQAERGREAQDLGHGASPMWRSRPRPPSIRPTS